MSDKSDKAPKKLQQFSIASFLKSPNQLADADRHPIKHPKKRGPGRSPKGDNGKHGKKVAAR